MTAPGTQHFTTFTTGKESTAGTSVATTYEWYGDGTGELNVDPMLALHRGNRGTRTSLAHATSMGRTVSITYSTDPDIGYAYDELHKLFGQMDGGNSGSGAQADKTWTIVPAQTGDPAAESYTIEVADDIQAWECDYGQVSSFSIEASVDSMTTGTVNWFAQDATKVTQTSVAANKSVRIPGYLWTPKFATSQSGLSGASASANFLRDFSINYQTGLVPRFYMDGTGRFGQSVSAAEVKADLTLHVESTALAISEFYDKFLAQTVSFLQLAATGPTLGSSNYSVTLEFALLYTDVKPIAQESEGVNIYEITAETVYDSTWTNSMGAVIVNSLATIT